MFGKSQLKVALCAGVLVALVLSATSLLAIDRHEGPEVVGVFDAIEQGRIAVEFIPRDSKQCRLLIRNKTDKPLSVALPTACAGVLAQDFPWPPPGGDQQQQQGPQPIGFGPNMMGQGRGQQDQGFFNVPGQRQRDQQQMPFQFFNIPPEKVAKLKFKTVCLEHGKPEPSPKLRYELKLLEEVTTKPGVREICLMLGEGKINQRTAQLAAWHLNNDMSWKKLAGMREKIAIGTAPRYTSNELRAGKKAAEKALEVAEKRKASSKSSPGES